jgi:hypothetical protein
VAGNKPTAMSRCTKGLFTPRVRAAVIALALALVAVVAVTLTPRTTAGQPIFTDPGNPRNPNNYIYDVNSVIKTGLRDVLQRLAVGHRHYGCRRLSALLRREGWAANHKRVLRLMRTDNLRCLRRRAFVHPPPPTRATRGGSYPT